MNKRNEEELLNAAFGEVSPEEAAQIERMLAEDAEAAKAYGTYRLMRDDLKKLAEVPQHQLSTERLRTAILTQGLKPGRSSLGFLPWLCAPAAAAAAVFGYIALSGVPQTSGPEALVAKNAPRTDVAPNWSPQVEDPGTVASSGVVEEAPAPSATTQRPRSEPRKRWRIVDRNPIRVVASRVHYGPHLASVSAPTGTFDAAPARLKKDAADDIILIQPERDAATGASRATEVGSSSNVLIGG